MYRSFRRIGLLLVALLCALGLAQVVLAAPPADVNFTITPTLTPLVGQPITVTSTATDPDADIVTTEWDFDYDGTFNADLTDVPTDNSATHTYTTAGSRDIAMRVTDGVVGDTNVDVVTSPVRTVTVVAPNVGPTASFTIAPNPADAGQSVTFNASTSSDPDGTIANDDHDWDLDGDGQYDDASGTIVTHSYPSGGTRLIGLRVTDSDNASDTAPTQTLTVRNGAPTAAFTISPNPAGAGQTVTFDGSASSDPEGPISATNHDWDLDGDGDFERTGKVVSRSYAAGASVQITLQVTDSNGVTDTETHTLTVTGGAPTASFTVSPNPARIGETVTLNGSTSSDPEGPLSDAAHHWDLDNDGAYDDATGKIVTTSYGQPGPKTIGLQVTDSDNVTATTSRSLTVNNTAPVAAFTVAPNPAQVNQTVSFDGSASNDAGDPGGSITAYRWDLDGDNAFDDATGQTATHSYPSPGTYEVRLQVEDNNGAVTTSNTRVLRINAPPNHSFTIAPNPAVLNETITVNASSSTDFDGSISAYEWDFDYNGSTFDIDKTGVEATTSYTTAGERTIGLRVRDNNGATKVLPRDLMVQVTRPNASFTFAPTAPVPGQTVGFTSRSTPSNAPGNPQILSTQWDFNYDPTKDFSPDASGATAATSFATPGIKTVGIKVTETGGGYAVTSGTVNVNAPPRASFNIAPANPFEGDAVTLSSTSGDPDGPITGHQWDLDGDGQYDDASGAVVSRAFSAGAHTVRLRVTDSRGAAATTERRINAVKRPPKLLSGVKVTLFGDLTRTGVQLKRLVVRTPAKTTVKVSCKGRKCPEGARAASRRTSKTTRLRFKKFERSFPAGTLIKVTVTRPGYIGQYTSIRVRSGLRRYIRRDRCILPGATKPTVCPDS